MMLVLCQCPTPSCGISTSMVGLQMGDVSQVSIFVSERSAAASGWIVDSCLSCFRVVFSVSEWIPAASVRVFSLSFRL